MKVVGSHSVVILKKWEASCPLARVTAVHVR